MQRYLYLTNGKEEQSSFQKVCNVIEYSPGLHMYAVRRNLVVVDAVEEQRQRLEEDERGHDPVYPEHLLRPSLLQDKHPETPGQEEEDGEHLIESWQWHLSS